MDCSKSIAAFLFYRFIVKIFLLMCKIFYNVSLLVRILFSEDSRDKNRLEMKGRVGFMADIIQNLSCNYLIS